MQSKIILGIDPGYARMGWGVINVCGSAMTCLGCGCIETPQNEELGTRLCMINEELMKIIARFQPSDISIEELFFAKNTKTAMNVAAARGVVLLRAFSHSGRIFAYRPNVIKLATAGVVPADKKQMQAKVTEILHLAVTPKPDDAADALAIAITHAAHCK